MARWWLWDEYPYRLVEPTVDLWIGGPNADGRGLDAANGGHNPAPGLQITSPTADPGPSGQARQLLRTHHQTWSPTTPLWAPKAAGVLAGIGGRVWTGSGWTYAGASDVTCLGPVPALSTPGVTDTVRRYTATTGLTVSDAAGGIVQSYSQRCDVAAGQSGGGWIAWPPETVASVVAGDQAFWHGIVETADPALFAPEFGGYSDGFFDGFTGIGQLSAVGEGASGNFLWAKRHLGTGPNGGTLVEYWVSQVFTQTKTSVGLCAYLLNTSIAENPARTLYIHNHTAVVLPVNVGRTYTWPTWLLVGAGAAPSLVAETLEIADVPWTPCTVLVRVDARSPEQPTRGGIGGRLVGGSDGTSTIARIRATLDTLASDGSSHPSGVAVPQALVTLGATCTAAGEVRFWHDGAAAGPSGPPKTFSGAMRRLLQAGASSSHLLMRVRRIQIWPRLLSPAEIAAAHAAIVAAEGGA